MSVYRLKLRRLLQESSLYRPQLLLGKIKDTDLYAECAILYGKVIMHCFDWYWYAFIYMIF